MNHSIGEREVLIGGVTFTLRPDFAAIEQLETMSGKGILPLLASYADISSVQSKDLVYALFCLCKSGSKGKFNYNLSQFGQMVVTDGLFNHLETVIECLSFTLVGGKKKEERGQ